MKLVLEVHWIDGHDKFFNRPKSELVIDGSLGVIARVYKDQWNLRSVQLNCNGLESSGLCSSINEGKEIVEDILKEKGIKK